MTIRGEQGGQSTRRACRLHGLKAIWFVMSSSAIASGCDASEPIADELIGLWQSQGYGLVAEITPDKARLIERTPVSCLLSGEYDSDGLPADLALRQNGETRIFEVRNDGTLAPITFVSADDGGFDRVCPTGLTRPTDDPVLNFEVLWQTFDQHYAFFPERNVDWQAIYAEFRPRVGEGSTRRELGHVLDEMLERLGDAHVALYIDDQDVVSVASPLSSRLVAACRDRLEGDCNPDAYLKKQYALYQKVLKNDYLNGRLEHALDAQVMWGAIEGSTAYFRVDSMSDLDYWAHTSADDLAALEPVLNEMLADVGHLPGMIVDVRLNGGGHDAVALAIASRFADRTRVFGSKRPHDKGGETTRHDLVLSPARGPRYQGPVVVLVSAETASAAEIFALAMRSLPQVTLVGEPTNGIFSDELYRSLPNGWLVSLSNEIYAGPDGEVFEAVGIPPDVVTPFLSVDDLQNGVDGGIDAAIAILKGEGR